MLANSGSTSQNWLAISLSIDLSVGMAGDPLSKRGCEKLSTYFSIKSSPTASSHIFLLRLIYKYHGNPGIHRSKKNSNIKKVVWNVKYH